MTDPLAIRIEAALTEWNTLANAALGGTGQATSNDGIWISDGHDVLHSKCFQVADTWAPQFSRHIAAFDPSSVLRLITGMRAILQVVPEIEDMEGQIQGEWGLSTDDPAEINECSNALLRTLASMLGIETNEETT